MTDRPTFWFPVKRHGWGWGLPVRWQGRLVPVAYTTLLASAGEPALSVCTARRAPQSRTPSLRGSSHGGKLAYGSWCPEPESNRHGLSAEGFSYQRRLSPLRFADRIRGLDFLFAISPERARWGSRRLRREPSSLYTFPDNCAFAQRTGLSSGLPPPRRAEVSPSLTPFTPGVSDPGAQTRSSPLCLPVSPSGQAPAPYPVRPTERHRLAQRRHCVRTVASWRASSRVSCASSASV